MEPEFPSHAVLLRWTRPETSRVLQIKISRGRLPKGKIRVDGEIVKASTGIIKDDLLEFEVTRWVPGTTTITVFIPNQSGGGRYVPKKLDLTILSPFYHWREYINSRVPASDPDEKCLLHSTDFKDSIAKLMGENRKRVLWLSGAPGSGKSFLLHHHLIPLLEASSDYILLSEPRERWEVFEKTSAVPSLKMEYRFDPAMQWNMPNHLTARFDNTNRGALLIDHNYDMGVVPDFVWELVLTVSESQKFHLEDFLLVVVDVLPIRKRLDQIRNIDEEAHRFLEPIISRALDNQWIQEIQIAPLDLREIEDFIATITCNKKITRLQSKHLLELTGGNRCLLACAMDTWQDIYFGAKPYGSVPQSDHLPRAGQQLFDRLCRSAAITPGETAEFIKLQEEQKGEVWVTRSPTTDRNWDKWVEGGVVLRQSEGLIKPRYFIPIAFRAVKHNERGSC